MSKIHALNIKKEHNMITAPSHYIHHLCIYMLICLCSYFFSVTAGYAADFSQQELIIKSCSTGTTTYWPPQEQHSDMCTARQLQSFMPHTLEEWEPEDIDWVIKTSIYDFGFRESKEIEAIYNAYHLYPFMKYIPSDDRGRVYVFGTIDHDKVHALQQDFDAHTADNSSSSVTHPNSYTRYYIDPHSRISPFLRRTSFRQAHISMPNRAYLLVYTEEVVDEEFITFFINSIDYHGIKSYVDQRTQQSVPTNNYNE